jgi:hypothetical protein
MPVFRKSASERRRRRGTEMERGRRIKRLNM